MIIIPPVKYRRRKRIRETQAQPPAEPPVLVAVAYFEGTWVRLTFDRAISISNLAAEYLFVDDNVEGLQRYQGADNGTLLDPQTVQIGLDNAGVTTGSGIRLSATVDIGIAAASDGAEWEGVTDVVIPFG